MSAPGYLSILMSLVASPLIPEHDKSWSIMPIDPDAYLSGAIPSLSRGGSWSPSPESSNVTSSAGGGTPTPGEWSPGDITPLIMTNPLWFPKTPFTLQPVFPGMKVFPPPTLANRAMPPSGYHSPNNSPRTPHSPSPASSMRPSPTSPFWPSPLGPNSHRGNIVSASGSSSSTFHSGPIQYGGWAHRDSNRSAPTLPHGRNSTRAPLSLAGSRLPRQSPPTSANRPHFDRNKDDRVGRSWERHSGALGSIDREQEYPHWNQRGKQDPAHRGPASESSAFGMMNSLRNALPDQPVNATRSKRLTAPPGYISPLTPDGYDRYTTHPAAPVPERTRRMTQNGHRPQPTEVIEPSPQSHPDVKEAPNTPPVYLPLGYARPPRELEWNRDGPAMKTYGVAWKRDPGGDLPGEPAGPRWTVARPPRNSQIT